MLYQFKLSSFGSILAAWDHCVSFSQSEGGESAAAPNGVLDSCLGVRGGWCQGQ